ncbi:T9SS type A sorting domain-containing protein [Thermonema sp.]|uniref:T9SS type A sorting domain-containing protein n=1 Tax=Thermonema sp. TaxID=2231181 RepID=UPI002582C583|nr:T9SS type A sorting domain-containing protein [Thermonema sp.]
MELYRDLAPPLPNGYADGDTINQNTTIQEEAQLSETIDYVTIHHVTWKSGNDGKLEIGYPTGHNAPKVRVSVQKDDRSITKSATLERGAGIPAIIDALPAGRYEVRLENVYEVGNGTTQTGCYSSFYFYINEPAPLNLQANADSVSCYGGSDGKIEFNITGGVKPYSRAELYREGSKIYELDLKNGETTAFEGLQAGNYILKVYDSGSGVFTSSNISVTQPDSLQLGFEPENTYASCTADTFQIAVPGGSDTLKATISGGTAPYSMKIFDALSGSLVNTLSGLGSNNIVNITLGEGQYRFVVTDSKGCEKTGYYEMKAPEPIALQNLQLQHVLCNGGVDGALRAEITGGIAKLNCKYEWTLLKGTTEWASGEGDAISIDNLISGNYTLKVIGAYGNEFSTSITINEPAKLMASLHTNPVSCFGTASGSVEYTLTGGTPPYTLYLTDEESGDTLRTLNTNSPSGRIDSLTAGQYKLSLLDANACPADSAYSFEVKAPEGMLSLSVNEVQDVSCYDGNDGKLFYSASGGWRGYTFTLLRRRPDATWELVTSTTTEYIEGLKAGIYKLRVRDKEGCETEQEVEIKQPEPLGIAQYELWNASCAESADGRALLTIQGGTPPYTATLTEGEGTIEPAGANNEQLTLSGLKKGSYRITITDSKNCQIEHFLNITAPAPLQLNHAVVQQATCSFADGILSFSIEGGTGPYTYTLYYGAEVVNEGTAGTEPFNIENLRGGMYRMEVKDANGCIHSEASIVLTTTAGPQIQQQILREVSCPGGKDASVQLVVTGGQAPYTLSGIGTQSYQLGEGDTLTLNGLEARAYTVSVVDAIGCVSQLLVTVPGPGPIEIDYTAGAPTCHAYDDGFIRIDNITGGTSPYTLLWQDGVEGAERQGLPAGTYTLKVIDKNACEKTFDIEVPETAPVKPAFEEEHFVICPGTTLALDAGNPGSTYRWSSGNGFYAESRTVELTEAGIYHLTITTPAGCVGEKIFTLEISNDLLQTEFLIASEGFVGDTLVAIDVTYPEPAEIEWIYDESKVLRLDNGNLPHYYAFFVFKEAGEYAIGLSTRLSGCANTKMKTVHIKERSDTLARSALGYREAAAFNVFELYPNPNEGRFKVRMELSKAAAVHVRIFNLSEASPVAHYQLAEAKEHELAVELPKLAPGVYVLAAETADGTVQMKRFVIR